MGYDYKASEEGEFLLEVRDYKTSEILGEIHLKGLNPFQKLACEVIIDTRE